MSQTGSASGCSSPGQKKTALHRKGGFRSHKIPRASYPKRGGQSVNSIIVKGGDDLFIYIRCVLFHGRVSPEAVSQQSRKIGWQNPSSFRNASVVFIQRLTNRQKEGAGACTIMDRGSAKTRGLKAQVSPRPMAGFSHQSNRKARADLYLPSG